MFPRRRRTADPASAPASAEPELPAPGLTPLELANYLVTRIDRSGDYVRTRKRRFRANSSWLKLTGLTLSATSTIILGLQDLDFWTGLAFSLVAVLTVLGALEPFFAWRSRWILMEEAAHRFHRLRDDVSYHVAASQPDAIDPAFIRTSYDEYQLIWSQLGERWLEHRQAAERGH